MTSWVSFIHPVHLEWIADNEKNGFNGGTVTDIAVVTDIGTEPRSLEDQL